MATGRLPDPNTAPVTAKGDLYTYSTVPAKLAVGNSGETLVADSSATTGLRWQGDYAAGKNKIINGDFRINQRGFTSTTTASAYTFDRFQTSFVDGTSTVSAETFTVGTAPEAGYEAINFIRLVSTGQTATNALTAITQRIEDVRNFAGQTVTVSFWAKASTGTPNVVVWGQQNFGSGGSPSSTVNFSFGNKFAVTTSWQRYSVTGTVPSISGKTIGTDPNSSRVSFLLTTSAGTDRNSYTDSLGIQSITVDFWGIQAEVGSVATAFQTATGTLAGELAACQRYFQLFGGNNLFEYFGIGAALSATESNFVMPWFVPMRTAPTATFTTASNYRVTQGTSANTATVVQGDILTKNNAAMQFQVASGLTAGNATRCLANNTLSATISVSAEL